MQKLLNRLVFSALLLAAGPALAEPDVRALYAEHCAECHGETRLGYVGPALLPGNLGRLRESQAIDVITNGRPATQMPAFSEVLSDEEVKALAAFMFEAPDVMPDWREADIEESREIVADTSAVTEPQFDADPMNLFIVVETGDHHATVLNGDTFEPMTRFPTRFALHGGPKFTPDGRYVFFMSRDGWVMKYDIWALEIVGEVRAGINSRNIAMSKDGKHLAVANYLPHTLVILSTADLSLEMIIDIKNAKGESSRISAVYQAPPRESWVLALKDLPEVWEVFYGEDPPFYGFVHDYRDEGPPKYDTPFPVRRIKLDDYLDDFFFDQSYEYAIGAARNAKNGQVVDLVIGRKIADLELAGLPHLGSGISWEWEGRTVMATPHLKESAVSIIDMKSWETIKKIETKGPGFFMRSHENSQYAWVDVFFGPNRELMHVIDKRTLEIVKTLKPAPGKTAAHIEFDRDGSHAILSVWDKDGEIIIYDARTLEEVKRLPMSKPSGKYNVWNKITFSAGTSH